MSTNHWRISIAWNTWKSCKVIKKQLNETKREKHKKYAIGEQNAKTVAKLKMWSWKSEVKNIHIMESIEMHNEIKRDSDNWTKN